MGEITANVRFEGGEGQVPVRNVLLHVSVRAEADDKLVFAYQGTIDEGNGFYDLESTSVALGKLQRVRDELVGAFDRQCTKWTGRRVAGGEDFRTDLIAPGAALAELVLSPKARHYLTQRLLMERGLMVLSVFSNYWNVPWELMHFGNALQGAFACEKGVIVRVATTEYPEGPAIGNEATLPEKLIGFYGGHGWPCDKDSAPGSCESREECVSQWEESGIEMVHSGNCGVRGPLRTFARVGQNCAVFHVVAHAEDGVIKLGADVQYRPQDVMAWQVGGRGRLVCLHCCGIAGWSDSTERVPMELHRRYGTAVFASMMNLPRVAGCELAWAITQAIRTGARTWLDVSLSLRSEDVVPFWRGYMFIGDYMTEFASRESPGNAMEGASDDRAKD